MHACNILQLMQCLNTKHKIYLIFFPAGNGTTVFFLKALIFLSGLASVVQLVFQIVLGSLAPYGHFLERCK